MAEITEDEAAKTVVDGDGQEIGIVRDVEDGTAYVDPDREMPSELKSKLNWSADTKDTFPLRNDAVAEITDEEIRLRDEYAGE